MKTLIVSNVLGNVDALMSIMHQESQIKQFVVLGGMTGLGGDPNECMKYFRDRFICLKSRYDKFVLSPNEQCFLTNPDLFKAIKWTNEKLSARNIKFIESLPESRSVDGIVYATNTADYHEAINSQRLIGLPKFEETFVPSRCRKYGEDSDGVECIGGCFIANWQYIYLPGFVTSLHGLGIARYMLYDEKKDLLEVKCAMYDPRNIVQHLRVKIGFQEAAIARWERKSRGVRW